MERKKNNHTNNWSPVNNNIKETNWPLREAKEDLSKYLELWLGDSAE